MNLKTIVKIWLFILLGIAMTCLWQLLEQIVYGTIQPRSVDTIMFTVWYITCVAAYMTGRLEMKREYEKRQKIKSQQHKDEILLTPDSE